jgi:hypothetical protein
MTLLEIRDRPRFLFIVASMALGGCAQTPDIACTMDAKACPDGSYVGRDPAKNCEFRPCPR